MQLPVGGPDEWASRGLRIGLDGHAFASPAGGVRRYVSELTTALGDIAPQACMLAVGAPADTRLPNRVVAVPGGVGLPTNLGWCLTGLPFGARRARLDVFHAPAYTAPLWGVHSLVVTLHDVSYERHPEWYPYRMDPVRRAFYRRSALAADLVITDSTFSRNEIRAAYGIDDARIRVIPLGVGPPFVTNDGRVPRMDAPHTLLHVGDLHARRNVDLLVKALAGLRARGGPLADTTLVLVGGDRGALASVLARARSLGITDAVRWVADADDDAVVALLRQASVFAYPSLYEGFGLPLLEAMACGVPVVASTSGSVPEVVGDAALTVDPHDVAGWVAALASVLTSPERAASLSRSGIARAATFSWHRTARMTHDVYVELASGPRAARRGA